MLSITCHRNPSWRGANSCLLMLIRTKLWYKQNLRRTGQNLVNNLVQYFIACIHYYSADTPARTLGRRLSNHNIFWKQKILKIFSCKWTNKIQGSTMQLSQETVLRFMDVIGPFETFVFRKCCDLTIFSSVLVWVSTQ